MNNILNNLINYFDNKINFDLLGVYEDVNTGKFLEIEISNLKIRVLKYKDSDNGKISILNNKTCFETYIKYGKSEIENLSFLDKKDESLFKILESDIYNVFDKIILNQKLQATLLNNNKNKKVNKI